MLKLLYITAYHSGIFKLFYLLKKQQVVVTYHNIISDDIFDKDIIHLGVSCSESAFVKQLSIISSRFKVTTEVGLSGTCIISFDDGYKNNLEIAAHHLNFRDIAGLFFIPASYFDNNPRILWVDQILMWISYIPIGKYSILGNQFAITRASQSRSLVWQYIYKKLLSDYSMLEPLLYELNNHYPFKEFKSLLNNKMYKLRFEAMTVEDLDQIKKMGHKIGCHSYNHDILSLLNDEQLENDFSMCSSYSIKYNSNLYSYPFGGKEEVSPAIITKCKKYGYSAAFLNYEPENSDNYSLGRISLGNLKDKYFIEAKLSGFERYLKNLLNSCNRFKKIVMSSRRRVINGNKTAI